jgi:hypothetical protein
VFCLIDDAKVSTKKHPAKKSFTGWEFVGVLGRERAFDIKKRRVSPSYMKSSGE